MDDLDIGILHLLQQNARMTVSDISGKVNLSVPAVSERIRKLETAGIIDQYVAVINPEKFGKCLTAIVFISLERPKFTEVFQDFVQSNDEILECHYLTGDFDYALKIITRSTSTLEGLLGKIKSVQGVQKTRTSVVLSTIKSKVSVRPEK